jgi:CHASE2 domain-containing sensor protein
MSTVIAWILCLTIVPILGAIVAGFILPFSRHGFGRSVVASAATAFCAIGLARLVHGWLAGPLPFALGLAVGAVLLVPAVTEAVRLSRDPDYQRAHAQGGLSGSTTPARAWAALPGYVIGTIVGVVALATL